MKLKLNDAYVIMAALDQASLARTAEDLERISDDLHAACRIMRVLLLHEEDRIGER